MPNTITRKEFLRNGSAVAAGAALGVGALEMFSNGHAHANKLVTPWPWPYQPLDVEAIRILGHDTYWQGKGCSYGAFQAMAEKLRLVLPTPWNSIPAEIMLYGHGGGAGWGATCGAINGPAALISLVLLKARSDVLVSELYGWYTQTLFPSDISNQYAVNHVFGDRRCDIALPQNVAGSPLCHPSVSEWCKTANYPADALQRKERCARITGDVAAYATQILNEEFAGTFTPRYVPPGIIATCMACHGTGPLNRVVSKMECTQCHGTNPHPTMVEQVRGTVEAYALSQNYPNPFNPSTQMEFSIPQPETVTLAVFDVHGRLIKNLVVGEKYEQGRFRVRWDGTNDAGVRVASGIYFARLSAGTFSAARKMNLVK